jgi:trehalose synthase
MSDRGQNAAMVNAIQRHASVVVQKSLAEGFGITVTEALWKSKPMVASAVGGINDQIASGCGVLLENPRDLQRFGDDIAGLLARPRAMDEMGRRAHAYVLENYIGDKHLLRYVDLFTSLLDSNL